MMWSSEANEEGATATMFVLALSALLAVALLAIDGGFLYASQRGQVADTDAAALAAAEYFAAADGTAAERCSRNDTDARAEAEAVLDLNDEDTSIESFSVEGFDDSLCATANFGVVTVTTVRQPVSIFSDGEFPTRVQTRAVFGQPNKAEGVRPIAFCVEEEHYREFLEEEGIEEGDGYSSLPEDGHPDSPEYEGKKDARWGTDSYEETYEELGAGVVHRVQVEKIPGNSCADEDGEGNWGWVDFDGGGANKVKEYIVTGYPGGVDLGDPDDDDTDDNDCNAANADPDPNCVGKPGVNASVKDPLRQVTCINATTEPGCDVLSAVTYRFVVPLCNNPNPVNGNCPGGGSNTGYKLLGVLDFILWDYSASLTGNPGDGDWLDIEFVRERRSGPVSAPDQDNLLAPDTAMCATGTVDNCPIPPPTPLP